MERHVKALAIANIIYGSAGGLLSLVTLLMVGGLGDVYLWGEAFGGFGPAALGVIAFHLVTAIPSIAIGVGLLAFQNTARMGGIVLSAASLLNIPIGSVLGIYGLWVLLTPETEPLFLDPVLKRSRTRAAGAVPGQEPAAGRSPRSPYAARIKAIRARLLD